MNYFIYCAQLSQCLVDSHMHVFCSISLCLQALQFSPPTLHSSVGNNALLSHCKIYTFWLNFNSVTYKVAAFDSRQGAIVVRESQLATKYLTQVLLIAGHIRAESFQLSSFRINNFS